MFLILKCAFVTLNLSTPKYFHSEIILDVFNSSNDQFHQ